ncbi:hypothetical protein [Streptomyces cellostaticus]|nr:hypothetical protein [Streptomyces cellostaticus]
MALLAVLLPLTTDADTHRLILLLALGGGAAEELPGRRRRQ